jgi:hypothetical protein
VFSSLRSFSTVIVFDAKIRQELVLFKIDSAVSLFWMLVNLQAKTVLWLDQCNEHH